MVTVIFRTGGTERFKWERILGNFPSPAHAEPDRQEIEAMGYRAVTVPLLRIMRDGLPTQYEGYVN